jgi:hypothetical protein
MNPAAAFFFDMNQERGNITLPLRNPASTKANAGCIVERPGHGTSTAAPLIRPARKSASASLARASE